MNLYEYKFFAQDAFIMVIGVIMTMRVIMVIMENIATGETSQAITSFIISTSLAIITK